MRVAIAVIVPRPTPVQRDSRSCLTSLAKIDLIPPQVNPVVVQHWRPVAYTAVATDTPLPAPTFFGYLTGGFEIVCGLLLIVGLLTRLAAIPMIVNMVGAELFTKLPVALQDGFWAYAHEVRAELSQLFGSLFLLVVGAGAWSLDAALTRRQHQASPDRVVPTRP